MEDRSRKRLRSQDQIAASLSPIPPLEHLPFVELDPALTRELTNRKYFLSTLISGLTFRSVFFTHCHPAVVIIHKPTFTSALSLNLVPSYLLHALCALAAPHSKQASLRSTPVTVAGRYFAEEAKKQIFNANGRLALKPSLHTAQATCLLSIYETMVRDKETPDRDLSSWSASEKYRGAFIIHPFLYSGRKT